MGRLRWGFLLFLALLAIPLGLLVREALATAAEERARAHRSAAQRLVDELERELTTWLETEEARPYGHYRYLYLPEGAESQAMVASPLAEPPSEPFVLGYFQLEPGGDLTSPRWPRDPAMARQRTGFEPRAEIRAQVEHLETLAEGLWATGPTPHAWTTPPGDEAPEPRKTRDTKTRDAEPPASDTPRPKDEGKKEDLAASPEPEAGDRLRSQQAGTTIPLDPKAQRLLAKKETEETGDVAEDDDSALGFLDQLNRGADARQQRPPKQVQSQIENYNQFLLEPVARPVEPIPAAPSASTPNPQGLRDALSSYDEVTETEVTTPTVVGEDTVVGENDLADEAEEGADDSDQAETRAGPLPQAVEVRYEPMVGRPTPEGHLVLYRTVVIAERAYRQGLVIDPAAMVRWLGDRVLEGSELADRVEILPDTTSPRVPEGGQAFRHRFAEPFAGLATVVVLARLADPGGRQLGRLALILALAVVFAFIALYRMVAVVVGFAERRSNFVSAVSHELKTPLTAIRMHGEMLRDGMVTDDEQRQRYYRILTGEAERLTRLVNNVLELSRLERRDRAVQMVAGDLGPVLDEVVALLGPHAEQKGFTLRLDIEDALPAVRFDRDALVQVLFNLVDNALKYAGGSSRREIVLAARHATRSGQGVQLRVLDHGPGVERRHLEKIFEPFYRGESELTRRAQGTGIGLALVRGLVERMGGTVRGRNRPEGGFEVTVALASAAGG